MTTLYDLGQNKFKMVTSSFGSREGSLRDVVQFAVFDLYIPYKEFEAALVAMNELEHDGADFGIFGAFIFSFSTKGQSNAVG